LELDVSYYVLVQGGTDKIAKEFDFRNAQGYKAERVFSRDEVYFHIKGRNDGGDLKWNYYAEAIELHRQFAQRGVSATVKQI
jgi:hypothetical protein